MTREDIVELLESVRELMDGYIDVVDGSYESGPLPNNAMKADMLIGDALDKLNAKQNVRAEGKS